MPADARAQALAGLSTLAVLLESSCANLASSSTVPIPASVNDLADAGISSPSPTSVTTLSDLTSLLTLLSKETTALSLALAPPSETWNAVEAVSKKLSDLTGKLVYAVGVLRIASLPEAASTSTATGVDESLLAAAWRNAVRTALEALYDLVSESCDTYSSLKPPMTGRISGPQRKKILTLTSHTWKAVERIQQATPKTEQAAFSVVWKDLLETFDDAYDETKELVQVSPIESNGTSTSNHQDSDEEDSDEDDGEFDDLDEPDTPLTPAEHVIAQKSLQIMQQARTILESLQSAIISSSTGLADLHHLGQKLLATHDDLTCSLHGPQSASDVMKNLADYRQVVSQLVDSAIASLCPAPSQHTNGTFDQLAEAAAALRVTDPAAVNAVSSPAQSTSKPNKQSRLRKKLQDCNSLVTSSTAAILSSYDLPTR
ncbi:hypothetical protein EMMF5_000799 [Cystobasidiomycetes sp. EMM_F5]